MQDFICRISEELPTLKQWGRINYEELRDKIKQGAIKLKPHVFLLEFFHSNKGEVDEDIISSVKYFDICFPSYTVRQVYGW